MRWRSQRALAVVAITAVGLGVAGIVGAYWRAGSDPGGSGHAQAGVLPPAATPTAALSGRNATVTWSQAVVNGTSLGQTAAGGYTIARYAEDAAGAPIPAAGTCAGVLTGATDPMSCTEPGLPTGRWAYTATTLLYSWVGAESAASATLTIAPAAPTSVALSNGAGAGNAFINATNAASLNFSISLPSTSLGSDTVTLTLNDGASPVTVQAPGIDGGGTLTFTAVDGSTLADGPIVISATATSSYGDASPPRSITRTKDTAGPTLTSLVMRDLNTNGKVDRVVATFSESLAAYSAGTAPWTLQNVPSGGTLASVSVSGTTATLTITEGAGAPDTAVGSFTVALATSATGIRDAAGNLSSFAASAPSDGARPVPVAVTSTNNGLVAGLMEAGDVLQVTFSEPLAALGSASTSITEADPSGSGSDRLTVTGLTAVAGVSTGSNLYVLADNSSASFDSSALGLAGAVVTATVSGSCTGTCVANLGAGIGALVFTPDPALQDAAGNTAAGSITTAATFRLF